MIGCLAFAWGPSSRTAAAIRARFLKAESHVLATAALPGLAPGEVALTFDDGPHARYTDEILEILKRYNAPAVFFQLGQNLGRVDAAGQPQPGRGSDVVGLIKSMAPVHGVPTWFALRIAHVESNYNPNMRGSHGEYGVFQMKCATAKDIGFRGNCAALLDPRTNILFVQDTASRLEEVRRIIRLLDTPIRQYGIRADGNFGPRSWTFECSDDGVHWTVFDTRSGVTFDDAGELKRFDITP